MSALEKHLTVTEVSQFWNLSDDKVRLLFQNEVGVLKIGTPSRKKRRYFTLRIPESVAKRVHEKLHGRPA